MSVVVLSFIHQKIKTVARRGEHYFLPVFITSVGTEITTGFAIFEKSIPRKFPRQ